MNIQNIKRGLFFLISILFLIQCKSSTQRNNSNIENAILHDKSNFFYVDAADYPSGNKKLPIGVFDSGTGGLTVLDAIVNFDEFNNADHRELKTGDGKKDFQKECFIYLGDQANMPYGNYSGENKVDLLKENVVKDVQFLLNDKYYCCPDESDFRKDKEPVKAIVIACNTATAYAKKHIEDFLEKAKLNLKVIGVIDAGVDAALAEVEPDEDAAIGVMATAGTVASMGYVNTLREKWNKLNYKGKLSVVQQAGVGLAGAIDGSSNYINADAENPGAEYKGPSDLNEDVHIDVNILNRYAFDWKNSAMLYEGKISNPSNIQINSVKNYIAYHVVSLMEKIKNTQGMPPLKSIILGCTHYPFYSDDFASELKRLYNYKENGQYIYRNLMNENIELIDPAKYTAKELYEYLSSERMFNNGDINNSEFYISVPNILNHGIQVDVNGDFLYDYKYGRDAGNIQEYVKRVPFSRQTVSPGTIERLSGKIPETFKLIESFNRENPKCEFVKEDDRL